MADYISREAAMLEVVDAVQSNDNGFRWGEIVTFTGNDIIKIIKKIPTTDVRPVVLCRDCENWDKSWLPNGDKSGNSHFCPMIDLTTDGDFFCSFGERRSDQNAG